MKNRVIRSTVSVCLLFMLSLGMVSCPRSDDSRGGDISPPVLTLTARPAEIKYSWTAANPDTGITYELYLKEGDYSDAKAVVENTTVAVTNKSGDGKDGVYTDTISSLKSETPYSAVVQAQNTSGKTVYSNVAQATPSIGTTELELRFGVISDTHLGATSNGSVWYPTKERLEKVLDWYNTQDGVKAVAIVGDITDNGTAADWNLVNDVYKTKRGNLNIISVLGNHDFYNRGTSTTGADGFENATKQKTNAHYKLGGYHFITITAGGGTFTNQTAQTSNAGEFAPDVQVLSAGRSATPGSTERTGIISSGVKTWLRKQIDDAKADAPGKPIFVFCHWPVGNTFYVSESVDRTDSFGTKGSWFANDPEVVIFGAHIHSPNSDPRSIWQDGFTSVNTVTTYYMEMESGYLGLSPNGYIEGNNTRPRHPYRWNTTTGAPDPNGSISSGPRAQGLIISVKGSKVTIDNYDFDVSEGRDGFTGTPQVVEIGQKWEFDVTKKAEFPYTEAKREQVKTKPVFADSGTAITGKIRTSDITTTSVVLDFDQARMPTGYTGTVSGKEVIHSYKFEFLDKASGTVALTVKQWSDFMNTPRLQKPTYDQLISTLSPGTNYEVRIYAYGSYQAESAQYLTAEFSTLP